MNDNHEPIRTIQDVIAYLFEALRNMRTYPIDGDFEEGYERAFNDIMYHLMANASPKSTAAVDA
jgi:hypothetical protein